MFESDISSTFVQSKIKLVKLKSSFWNIELDHKYSKRTFTLYKNKLKYMRVIQYHYTTKLNYENE